jgi:hypothetical protein
MCPVAEQRIVLQHDVVLAVQVNRAMDLGLEELQPLRVGRLLSRDGGKGATLEIEYQRANRQGRRIHHHNRP